MKISTNKKANSSLIFLLTGLFLYSYCATAQICGNNTTYAYGLTSAGVIHPVNLTTGAVGTALDNLTTSNAAYNANGMGYNSFNNKFYYFHRTGAHTAPYAEFVVYDPILHTLKVLPGTPPTSQIRSACIDNTGTGYYCLDPSGPTLYYYKFSTGTWTNITNVFKLGSTDVSAHFKNLVSGDMAFDAAGNLWALLSGTVQGSSKFAFYKISYPVPTTTQASVSVVQNIALSNTPNGVNITGFCFNQNGDAYLTSAAGSQSGCNKLYRLTTATGPLTTIATLSRNDAGADLTSCVFTYVLPVKWLGFKAELIKDKGVKLNWDVVEEVHTKQYTVERSTDGIHWQNIAVVKQKASFTSNHTQYTYTDYEYRPGANYYRVVHEDATLKRHFSEIIQVAAGSLNVSVSPNPATNFLNIRLAGLQATKADIFDAFGRLLLSMRLSSANESINVSGLAKGNYLLKLSTGTTEVAHSNFIKL